MPACLEKSFPNPFVSVMFEKLVPAGSHVGKDCGPKVQMVIFRACN